VVTPSDVAKRAAAAVVDDTTRLAYRAGLGFAAHLRRLFPDFYRQHVANRSTTVYHLLGVVGAFLSLAHTQLLALDMDAIIMTQGAYWNMSRMPFAPKDPRQALFPNHGDARCTQLLANEGQEWLHRPSPRVYGISVDAVTRGDNGYSYGRTISRHALALAIWRMIGLTSWSPLPAERVSELAAERCADKMLGTRIATLPTISPETPMSALCARLDRLGERGGLRHLGSVVALLCGRTGNGFADVTPEEARTRYDMVVDLDWNQSAEAFAPARADQQAAQALATTYSRLAGRFLRDDLGELLLRIRHLIWEAAQTVEDDDRGFAVYDARSLIWRVP
jgi:hypothetical protein